MNYQQLLDNGHIYDQSGITNPETYDWQPTNGIYYPIKKDNIVESEFYQKQFNECYNMGIDRAIEFCKSQKLLYETIDPAGPIPMVVDSIAKTLGHFKRY